jgi:hypothetical protein
VTYAIESRFEEYFEDRFLKIIVKHVVDASFEEYF